MKIVYMATADIAVPLLRALHASEHEVVAVYSQPDRPQGRKRKILPSPVKAAALELGLPVFTPEKVGDAREELEALNPDASIVFAYGQYIPSKIVNLPRLGSINVHPSTAPIQWSIADGLEETAISVIRLAKEMDAGDIVVQRPVPIDPDDTSASLSERMAEEAIGIIEDALALIADPNFEATPQNAEDATEARKLEKADRELDWTRSAEELRNWIRACYPWPGSVVRWGDDSGEEDDAVDLKILNTAISYAYEGKPGRQLVDDGLPVVVCGEGALKLVEVQPAGKKPMSGSDFVRGWKP